MPRYCRIIGHYGKMNLMRSFQAAGRQWALRIQNEARPSKGAMANRPPAAARPDVLSHLQNAPKLSMEPRRWEYGMLLLFTARTRQGANQSARRNVHPGRHTSSA